jgi:hypothetical protein
MSQYQVGTVVATNGSPAVTAVDPDAGNPDPADDVLAAQEWLTEVVSGDLFYIADDPVAYVVQSVNSDTSLTLASSYQGTTVVPAGEPLAGANYAIHRDFSTNYAFPLSSQGDIGLPVFLQLVIIDFDTELKLLDDRVTALEP